MYRLRRILTLVLLPLFLAGCGSGGEDSEVELQVAGLIIVMTKMMTMGVLSLDRRIPMEVLY